MPAIKSLFPDTRGLHARIDTLARATSIPRVSFVSRLPRARSKALLEAIVADPIDDAQWFPQFVNRPLSKDILVTQSDSFEFIQTRNSLTEFPLPISHQAELLEVTPDSTEHIETADLLVELVDGPSDPLPFDNPTVQVQNDELNPPKHNGDRFRVDLGQANAADELLRKSPKNISQYIEGHKVSGIEPLKQRIFRPVADLRRDLASSVVRTCAGLMTESRRTLADSSAVTERAMSLRTAWSRDAHQELQVLLEGYSSIFAGKLAWYNLYHRLDDIGPIIDSVNPMSQSRTRLDYAAGQIDAMVQGPHSTRPSVALDILAANINTAATRLHNAAVKALVATVLGLQAPICAAAGAGIYFGQFSPAAMGGLAALGIVLGFRRLQTQWFKATDSFKATVNSETQTAITQSETTLWSMYEEKRANQATHLKLQSAAVDRFAAENGVSATGDVAAATPAGTAAAAATAAPL